VSRDDDRPGFLDREKKSFSELDRRRREGGGRGRAEERRPAGPAQQARLEAAKKQYLKQIDGVFAKGKGGAGGERLAAALREARGTPGLAAACRAYRDAVGPPADAALIACFLDADDPELALAGLEALREALGAGRLALGSGLRTQLRMLAGSSDDAVASAAEDLLEAP
jgi:hypothetical protein